MKNTKWILPLVAIVSAQNAHSAIVSINNVIGNGTELIFTDDMGSPIATGFVALFDFATNAPTTAAELSANGTLNQIGITLAESGNSPEPGIFSGSIDFTNTRAGANLFLAVGNGTSVSTSTFLGLIQLDDAGLAATSGTDEPTPQSIGNYDINDVNDVRIGTTGTGTFDLPLSLGNGFSAQSLNLVAVPEPSSVLLSSLALLAFAGRRKRA